MKQESIRQALEEIIGSKIRTIREVQGGDIGVSLYVEAHDERYFVKYRDDLSADVFLCEAEGLKALQQSGGLPVPAVHYAGAIPGQTGGMIVLEWIERGAKTASAEELLGQGLAAVHRHASDTGQYGFMRNNYIGVLPQSNRWESSWVNFYREQRLLPLIKMAEEQGRLTEIRRKRFRQLLNKLDTYLADEGKPNLLHGDLWGGNWLADLDGKPILIDPAVYYGNREVELAFTELFSGFSHRFYAAYQEAYPLLPDYEERKPLYQLYYLMVHLIHFGEAYGPSVDRVLARYA